MINLPFARHSFPKLELVYLFSRLTWLPLMGLSKKTLSLAGQPFQKYCLLDRQNPFIRLGVFARRFDAPSFAVRFGLVEL